MIGQFMNAADGREGVVFVFKKLGKRPFVALMLSVVSASILEKVSAGVMRSNDRVDSALAAADAEKRY